MAKKWNSGDSARTMVSKFNEVVDEISSLQLDSQKLDELKTEINKLKEAVDNKLESMESEIPMTAGLIPEDSDSQVIQCEDGLQRRIIFNPDGSCSWELV